MIERLLLLVLAVWTGSIATADEAINKAYLEGGLATAKLIKEECVERIDYSKWHLEAVRNGIKEEFQQSRFEENGKSLELKYFYSNKAQKDKSKKLYSDKLNYYQTESKKHWQTPVINVFDAQAPTGAVGVLRNLSEIDYISDPIQPYKVKVDNVSEGGFLADVHLKNGRTVWFQGFDHTNIAIGAIIPITDVVVVVGPTETPLGRYMTIRKLTKEELYEAEQYAAKNMPNFNMREWTDLGGKFKIVAELISAESGNVTLKKKDGSILNVPFAKLSKVDRQWIKDNPKE